MVNNELYIPKYFNINELTPPEMESIIRQRGSEWAFATLFDPHLLITIDRLRELYGPMTCNDWYRGGSFRYRGFRPGSCSTGSEYSQHRFGRAADLIPLEVSVYEIRADILANPDHHWYKYIGGLEMDVTWLHIDTRQRRGGDILKFNP
jgi:hypothetical protein